VAPRSQPPGPTRSPPGIEKPKRFLPAFHYELISCGLRGHELIGLDAAHVRPQDATVVREEDGVRWHRCLRCDSWLPLPVPENPARDHPPEREQIALPIRGRPLRDAFVLRLIALDRGLHFLILAFLSVAVFTFAANRDALQQLYVRVLEAVQGGLGGPTIAAAHHRGLLGELSKVFAYSPQRLFFTGVVLAAYGMLEAVEMVGLWMMKRWAEYLTFVVTASLLPLEIYELSVHVSLLKLLAFVINVAVVVYLAYAKRLFGVRGGVRAEEEQRARDVGWAALDRSTPPLPIPASPLPVPASPQRRRDPA
jgi:uncharacterized membrane protein (DUF2068 family)